MTPKQQRSNSQALSGNALCLAAAILASATLAGAEFSPARIFSSPQPIAAIASGDFDSTHPGDEIACLLGNGSVVALALSSAGWTTNTIYQYKGSQSPPWEDPRSRVTLNVGDVLSDKPGLEVVVSFRTEIVAVYHDQAGGWTNQVIADFTDAFGTSWGAEVGDCDPAHAGEEVFSIFEGTFDFSMGTVFTRTNAAWDQNLVYNAEVGMDAAIGDSNPDVAGSEIIVVTEMGPAYEIMPAVTGGPGPWPKRTIWDDFENAGWVVKIGDVDPATPGNEIVYGTRYSDRILMSRYNGTNSHQVDVLFTGVNTNELNNMLDVAIGQVFPDSLTAEILGVDASGSVYVVQQNTNLWQGSVLWRDTNALYAVAAADLISSPGDEVLVGGASGALTLLSNPTPALNVNLTPTQQTVLSWTAMAGVTYSIQTTTNLVGGAPWTLVADLAYEGGFLGILQYTNAPAESVPQRFFRIQAGW